MQNPRDNMSTSLKRGLEGELEFLKIFPHRIEKLPGTGADFYLPDSKETLELKTEYRPTTLNFFFEFIRNTRTGAPGGPFQSLQKLVDWYAYWCVAENKIYYFRVPALCLRLRLMADELPVRSVPSYGDEGNTWFNMGYLVKKELLKEITMEASQNTSTLFKFVKQGVSNASNTF